MEYRSSGFRDCGIKNKKLMDAGHHDRQNERLRNWRIANTNNKTLFTSISYKNQKR